MWFRKKLKGITNFSALREGKTKPIITPNPKGDFWLLGEVLSGLLGFPWVFHTLEMQSGSKLNPERSFEFASSFISVLVTRLDRTTRVCPDFCVLQYLSIPALFLSSIFYWRLKSGRHRAPLAPTDFTGTWWAFTPTSVMFSCFQIFRERPCFLLLGCQEPLASQTPWTEIIPTAVHPLSQETRFWLGVSWVG